VTEPGIAPLNAQRESSLILELQSAKMAGPMRHSLAFSAATLLFAASCRHSGPVSVVLAPPIATPAPAPIPQPPAPVAPPSHRRLTAAEKGVDGEGIPLYLKETFTAEERDLLRRAFGVESASRLYYSDSSEVAILKYDVKVKTCRQCFVNSYRLGFLSTRRPQETWDDFDSRVRATRLTERRSPNPHKSLDELDPEARIAFDSLLAAAQRSRFRLTILETYRTPERETELLAQRSGKTYTATSMHSYGRAVDISVEDGNTKNPKTRAEWVRFRRFVTAMGGGRFRLVGQVAETWDWSHIELPGDKIGFRSVDDALAFARQCLGTPQVASRLVGRGSAIAPDPCVIPPKGPATLGTR
jgi:hypothetical protein